MVLMAATTSVVYQKTKTERTHPSRIDGGYSYHCAQDPVPSKSFYDFLIRDEDRADFVEITLVGGGAGGGTTSDSKGGAAGEVVNLAIPSMNGVYRVVLGPGGNPGQNGGTTALYVCPSSADYKTNGSAPEESTCESGIYGGWILIESARGGSANNELAAINENEDGRVLEQLKGDRTSDENGCGFGGDATQAGTMGAAYISW